MKIFRVETIWKTFLKGLATILPITLTLYFLYWLAVSAEKALRPIITVVLPQDLYWPGLGLLIAVLIIFCIGIAVNAWLVKRIFEFSESLFDRIPLVKSIYGALRDFTNFLSRERKEDVLSNAVVVQISGVKLIGFKVRDDVSGLLPDTGSSEDPLVAVYLPMSYQIGGYTVCIPSSTVQPLEISNEDAMRWILTAGLSSSENKNEPVSPIITDISQIK